MRCCNCMKELENEYQICPYCGYKLDSEPEVLYHLFPGTVLQKRYVIGIVIGSGGFGVTYKAWDMQLETVIAIKEYYPLGLVTRVPGKPEIIVYSGSKSQNFEKGLERFLEEAKKMAKFSFHENIVNAYNYFGENNTAYIVMEFLDGVSFKDFLIANGGKTTLEFAKEIVLSVAKALQALHKENIIHRDVSPDNIFLLTNGQIKLIDFGAARLSDCEEENPWIELKPGYAPPEQYQQSGNQGAWTDVYALGATMYRAVTGKVPEESVNREQEDTLLLPDMIEANIPEYISNSIMRAMALNIAYRFSSIDEFVDALTNKKKVLALEEEIKRRKKRRVWSLAAAILILIVAGGLIGYQYVSVKNGASLDMDLEVWVCADTGEDSAALEKYYQSVSDEVFGKDYQKVKLTVKAIPESEYERVLLEAFQNGTAPDVFESTNISEDVLEHGMCLDNLITEISQGENDKLENYYFLSDYRKYIPEGKRFPIGFSIPVAYSVQREYALVVKEDEIAGDSKKIEHAGDSQTMIQQLSNGECIYLIGDTTDYDMVQKQIYGTYEQQKENIAGKINLSVIDGKEPEFTTTFSVRADCNREEKQEAYLFLQYLVSYQEQYLLHASGSKDGVYESNAFSVNVRMDEEYRSKLKSAFSVLDDTVKAY